jgi:hypothetical protein
MDEAHAYASFEGQKTIFQRDTPAVEFALREVRRLIAEKTRRPV